ncbi:MAG: hypothetical protein WKF97_01425 [Chitinophagaceae bacterium]
MDTQEQEDIQALLQIFLPFAEELLVKYGEFHPYAGATTITGEFVSVGSHKTTDHPDSRKAINQLKHTAQSGSDQYLVVAVFYEAISKDGQTGETADAIGVFVEHKESETAYEFLYAYRVDDNKTFAVDDSYGTMVPKEIFN